MAKQTKAQPYSFPVKTASGREGIAHVAGGMITVTGTSGATGSKSTQVGNAGDTIGLLATVMLGELPP